MNNTKYNGWTNYETWHANMSWAGDFDMVAAEAFRDAEAGDTFSKVENAAFELAEYIKDTIEEATMQEIEGLPTDGLAYAFVTASLSEINYFEIAKHYVEKIELEYA